MNPPLSVEATTSASVLTRIVLDRIDPQKIESCLHQACDVSLQCHEHIHADSRAVEGAKPALETSGPAQRPLTPALLLGRESVRDPYRKMSTRSDQAHTGDNAHASTARSAPSR